MKRINDASETNSLMLTIHREEVMADIGKRISFQIDEPINEVESSDKPGSLIESSDEKEARRHLRVEE